MPLVLADRVRDTTTTAGTGTVTLSGTAPTGFQNFSVIGNGNTTYYTIAGGSQWEVGIGTYSSTGPTLSRDTVLASSAGGTTKVTFSAGTKDVFVTYPSAEAVYQDGATIAAGTSVLAAANGGTGNSSYTIGDILFASGATALSKLADVATGNALISGGVGVAPLYGKIGLTTHVSGTLPIANGGTGSTSTTYCNLTTNVTGTLPTGNGGTGLTTFTAANNAIYSTSSSALTAGTLPVTAGGTGQTTYTDGQLLIGNTTGNTLTKATLTQGSGVIVTNGAGAITLASTRDFQEFTSSGTWTKPSGVSFVMVECWGAGGGGGSGQRGAAATNRTGGGGGGGGAYTYRLFKASDLGATETVTIGAGGTGGAARTTDGNSNAGVNGGNTTFGTKLTSYGGGRSGGSAAGSGGGALSAASAATQGQPSGTAGVGHFGGASANSSAGFGGAAGASATVGSVEIGACSYQGGAGGGGGGQITAANATSAGTAGGFNAGTTGGGGAGGGSGTGTAGAAGTDIGMAGGGGGSGNTAGTVAGGAGGAGGIAAGGGGGGASTTGANSGAGGKGGDGYCRVYSW